MLIQFKEGWPLLHISITHGQGVSIVTYHNNEICGSEKSPIGENGQKARLLPEWEVQRVMGILTRLRIEQDSIMVF